MRKNGQILIGVIVLLAVMAILVPTMLYYVQSEARWSEKERQNTNALQLAESAVDRAYQKIVESTSTWNALKAGVAPAGFKFDTVYRDITGGSYTVSVTSGPLSQQVTIIGIGRDKQNKETRALQVVYGNSIMSDVSIAAAKGVTMNGNNIEVEWGAVSSPQPISILTKTHPSFWSASSIDKDTSGPARPNDDPNNWWWHSYYSGLPPIPTIDFAAYKSSAINAGNDPCGNAYYQPGNFTGTCNSLTGKTYYIEGNWTGFKSAIIGNVIVLGNLTFKNGSQSTVGSYSATVPPKAWKQYCNDWTYYRDNYDSGVTGYPACFGNINNSYQTNKTKTIDPAIHGFMYVGGNLTLPNGGGSDDLLHGAIIVNGTADINSNSHCRIYYDDSVAEGIMTLTVTLARQSWLDSKRGWPSWLP